MGNSLLKRGGTLNPPQDRLGSEVSERPFDTEECQDLEDQSAISTQMNLYRFQAHRLKFQLDYPSSCINLRGGMSRPEPMRSMSTLDAFKSIPSKKRNRNLRERVLIHNTAQKWEEDCNKVVVIPSPNLPPTHRPDLNPGETSPGLPGALDKVNTQIRKLKNMRKTFGMSQGRNKLFARKFNLQTGTTVAKSVQPLPKRPLVGNPNPAKPTLKPTRSTKDLHEAFRGTKDVEQCQMHYCDYQMEPPIEGTLVIEVSDNGCGISPEDKARLFKPFSQANKSIQGKYGGTGLGLWVCQRLIVAMEGSIDCKRNEPAGTTFMVTVPCRCQIGVRRMMVSGWRDWQDSRNKNSVYQQIWALCYKKHLSLLEKHLQHFGTQIKIWEEPNELLSILRVVESMDGVGAQEGGDQEAGHFHEQEEHEVLKGEHGEGGLEHPSAADHRRGV